jgi:hypothetical protein
MDFWALLALHQPLMVKVFMAEPPDVVARMLSRLLCHFRPAVPLAGMTGSKVDGHGLQVR